MEIGGLLKGYGGKVDARGATGCYRCEAYEFLAGRVGWQEMGIFLP